MSARFLSSPCLSQGVIERFCSVWFGKQKVLKSSILETKTYSLLALSEIFRLGKWWNIGQIVQNFLKSFPKNLRIVNFRNSNHCTDIIWNGNLGKRHFRKFGYTTLVQIWFRSRRDKTTRTRIGNSEIGTEIGVVTKLFPCEAKF